MARAGKIWSVASAAIIGLWGWGSGQVAAIAADASTAPADLLATLEQIETAANAQDLAAVRALISDRFVHGDGFDAEQYASTLSAVWAAYSNLQYDVELLSWEAVEGGYLVETVTTMTGNRTEAGRAFTLTATVRSRQRFEGGQMVSQEVLTESARLAAGANPPDLIVQLPQTVRANGRYSFDAIVPEPLGDDVLLGRAFEEGVTGEDFLTPRPVDLEALAAGGLFKIGRAPDKADQRWVSAIVVRSDGFVIETRRLTVTD
ncbi:MAG: nuclear transport factor 2 family protein [Leptolyngbya sp.]|nr:nuclear transport factor 2 family protein [Leptolyngbya sp.]